MPKAVLRNPNFLLLTPYATKLLLDLGEQYIGTNNGDLCATWSLMRERGWKSKDTLNNTLKELVYYGFIAQTQYGGLNRPTLYALNWFKIDKAKAETGLKPGIRLNEWHHTKRKYRKPERAKRTELKKTQVRLAVQSSTPRGVVVS